jgi:hypothetical protein
LRISTRQMSRFADSTSLRMSWKPMPTTSFTVAGC